MTTAVIGATGRASGHDMGTGPDRRHSQFGHRRAWSNR
jgi:hypothetical protein